eukprot:CAMPEP_0172792136 /NCGR_PEP_ID=MMETSP1074-20121228/208822_1 /TAXON_ID=2916 /ORGANISM="Ceratium fusus, Strain PA161109" /LENGTH=535 /DNA_ID=CAMNT_0013629201 /DNA_START=39 /DNA_END=1646 /DNA_ORIENTATION=+
MPQQTPRESLRFLAELRFGIGTAEAKSPVDELLALLKLVDVADQAIGMSGVPGTRISGGQRKRLCIARELLSDPTLLLCDEPTSGLDSSMAEQVVSSLRGLCKSGNVSVMSSIHQPSTIIFEQFDDLLLLKEGAVIYWGPPTDVERAFLAHGPSRNPSQSVSEYMMDCLVRDDMVEQLRIDELKAVVDKKAASLSNLGKLSRTRTSSNRYLGALFRYNAPFVRQLVLLFQRHGKHVAHTKFNKQNIVLNVGLVVIACLLWLQLEYTDKDVRPRFTACIWAMGTWLFFPLFEGMMLFLPDRPLVTKELKVGCYPLSAYYIARTLLMLPLDFVWPTFWVTSFFWATRLSPSPIAYVIVLPLMYLNYMVFQGVGLLMSAANMPMSRANTVSLLFITYLFAWSGLMMDMSRAPRWLHWASDGNIFGLSISLMFRIITEDVDYTCSSNGSGSPEGCNDGVLTGAEAREWLGVDRNPQTCVLSLVLMLVLCRLLSFVLLRHSLRDAIDGARSVGPQQQGKGSESVGNGQITSEDDDIHGSP